MKSKFLVVGLACFLLFCVAPASALAGSVFGKITAVGGAPIAHAQACVRDVSRRDEPVSCAQANEEGEYTITSIAPDEYKLYFEEPQGGPEYVVNYWPEKASFDEGVPFQIAGGETIEANGTLVAAGRIEGTLTAEGEAPLSGKICAYKTDGIRIACGSATGESGYRIRDLAPGSYVVEFAILHYQTEYSGGVKDFTAATPVTVQAFAAATASADLEAEQGISGIVTDTGTGDPVENVRVCAENKEGEGGCAHTDKDGGYTIYLLAGTYRISFEVDGYVTEYYDDVAESAHATRVTVAGSQVRGVDAALDEAGSITGQVATNDGQGNLSEVNVCALSASSEECVYADNSGAYEFLRLAPGSYKVRFSLNGYFTQFFDDKATEAEAESVTVTANHESGGVDATLVAEEAPTNVIPPLLSGVGKVGETLSCSNGVWSGNPPSFTYEYFWFRGEEEEEIEGAESSTYTLGIADAGETIYCAVVATNSAGTEYEFSSNEIVVAGIGTVTVIKEGGGTGTVSSAPAGIDCGVSCAGFFEEGAAITLTAVADSGSEFTGWSGACSGTGPCAFTIGGDAEVVANFAKTRGGGGRGGGSTNPSPPGPTPPPSSPPKHVTKKALECKKGFHKAKHKGKVRCVKPKHKSGGKPTAKATGA